KIQTFREHLCAYQNIDFLLLKCVDNLFITVFATCGVKIHSRYLKIRKKRSCLLFYLLGSETFGVQFHTFTSLAVFVHHTVITAIMTTQFIFKLMIGQTHVTIRALWRMAARVAFHNR